MTDSAPPPPHPPKPLRERYAWMYEHYPELTMFPDEADRRATMKLVQKRVFGRNPLYWLYFAVLMGLLLLFGGVTIKPLLGFAARLGVPKVAALIIVALFAVVGFYLGLAVFFTRAVRRTIRKRLRELGVAVCLKCGYDCRGQTTPRCPECGTQFDPALLKNSPTPTTREGDAA